VRFFIVPDMLRYVETHIHTNCDGFSSAISCLSVLTIANFYPLLIGTLPCSAHEASAAVVSVLRVVGLPCSVRAVSGGVERDMGDQTRAQFYGLENSTLWLAFVICVFSSSFYFQGFLKGGNFFLRLPVRLAGPTAGGISPLLALHYYLGHE
jgi:hypothetical protein